MHIENDLPWISAGCRSRVDPLLGWATVLLSASLPVSVFLDNLLTLLILLLVLLFHGGRLVAETRQNKAVLIGFPLFALLLSLVPYGEGALNYSFSILGKYLDLILIPVFVVAMRLERVRARAQDAFLISSGIVMALSYLLKLGVLQQQSWMWWGAELYNAPFHHYLVQNSLMAYAVYLALLKARSAGTQAGKAFWSLFVVLGLLDIFGIVVGRTGQLVMLALGTLFLLNSQWFSELKRSLKLWVGLAIMCLLTIFPLIVDRLLPQSAFDNRFKLAVTEAMAWNPNVSDESSVGARLGFYYNSLTLIEARPLLGYGTGGFAEAYSSRVKNPDGVALQNPHNQYLLVGVQAGLVGIAVLLLLFQRAWRHSRKLQNPFDRNAAAGVVLAIAIDSLFNSPLLDHTGGLFFAYMMALWLSGAGQNQEKQSMPQADKS